jgi:hypothetical protein
MRPLLAILMLNFVAAAMTNAEHTRGQTTPDDISLGTVRLTLGMAQDAVLATLGKSYDLEKLTEGQQFSSWLVNARTGTEKLAPPKYVGNVTFRQGKLTTVMKNWAPENQQKGVEFATSLYDVMTSFTNEGRTVCSIETGRKKDPGYDGKAIFVTCGAKYIRIDLLSGPQGESTSMAEVLGHN